MHRSLYTELDCALSNSKHEFVYFLSVFLRAQTFSSRDNCTVEQHMHYGLELAKYILHKQQLFVRTQRNINSKKKLKGILC